MRVRHLLTALCVAISSLLVLAGLAQASPITVNVRIEGATETLFEGPLAVEAHGVKASSDTDPYLRPCDGINSLDPGNTAPAPTPTSSAADALATIGETFDGKWYPGFDDYFITRFGPDREAEGKSWGVLVNNTFTEVGGCQYQLGEGDEVLWVFNAFNFRPFLALFPAGYPSGARPLTATATLGQPFEVEVVSYEDDQEDIPSEHPERTGSTAYPGADVSPVTTNAEGFERVDTADPATVLTNSEGKAQITFTTPGWHRIKATVPGLAEEGAIRSNRLDVCVPEVGETECGPLPAEDQVRVPPPTVGEEEPVTSEETHQAEETGGDEEGSGEEVKGSGDESSTDPVPVIGSVTGGGSGQPPNAEAAAAQPATATAKPGALRVSVPSLDRAKLRQGRLGVSWKILAPGAGVARWTIDSQTVGAKKAPYVTRASGTANTSTSLRLPPGTYRLRFTITDARGRRSSVMVGKVVVPDDKRR